MPDAGNPGMGPPPTPPDRVEYEINELVKRQVEIGMDIISNGKPAGIGPGPSSGWLKASRRSPPTSPPTSLS